MRSVGYRSCGVEAACCAGTQGRGVHCSSQQVTCMQGGRAYMGVGRLLAGTTLCAAGRQGVMPGPTGDTCCQLLLCLTVRQLSPACTPVPFLHSADLCSLTPAPPAPSCSCVHKSCSPVTPAPLTVSAVLAIHMLVEDYALCNRLRRLLPSPSAACRLAGLDPPVGWLAAQAGHLTTST